MSRNIGTLGEEVVIEWLDSKSYRILHHSWHCRWGEIDIVAFDEKSQTIAFVEVKTRRSSNWDKDGLLAVSEEKQKKLSLSAALFLSKNRIYNDCYIRFDVASVLYHKQNMNSSMSNSKLNNPSVKIKNQHCFRMVQYIENAFDASYDC